MQQASFLDADRTPRQWVSVSDAARLEGAAGRAVNKSSISRFLDRNPDVVTQRDDQGRVKLVDYLSLSAARATSLSVQDSRPMAPMSTPPATMHAPNPTSRKRELEERKLELDLAEREGDLLDRTAMTMALEAIAVTLGQSLERRRRKLATDTVDLGDVRAGELVIKAADREMMATIITKLQELAGHMISGAAEGEATEAMAA